MASSAGSKAGLVTTVVILAIVSVTALVFAFIFSADARKNQADLETLTKAYNDVVRRNALTGPTVVALRERRGREPFTGTDMLLDVAVRERDDLAKLLGGATAEAAATSATTALTDASAKIKAAGLPDISTTENVAGSITAMGNAIETLARQVADLTKAANDAKAQAAQTVEQTTAALAAKDKQIADIRAEAAAAKSDAAKDRADRQGVADEINANVEKERKALADAMQQLSTKLADESRRAERLSKELTTTQGRLAAFRPDAQNSVVRKSDGSIARVANSSIVYIDLGAGDQITPGMTFEVYDKLTGVPALKADETSMPIGKASIEVVRVSPTNAEARVISTRKGAAPITEGDVIANLVYDRNTRYNFVVFGDFDLARRGKPSAEDGAVVKRLVTEWGGTVQPQIDVNTDFLVIGAEPQIPEATSEQDKTDPIFLDTQLKARQALDNYNAVLSKARELYIPVLNQNRFLYYTGYFDQAKR